MRLLTMILAVMLAFAAAADAQVARIRGTVKTDQGEPVTGAVVAANSTGAQPNAFTATTNDKGEWAMLGLRSGVWSLVVTADGYEAARGDVRVSSFDRGRTFDFILARTSLERATGRIDPDAVQADLTVADEHAAAGRWTEAIEGYSAILRRVPALTTVFVPLGRAYREAGRLDEAIEAFKAYLDTHARSQVGLVELGRTYLATSDQAAAAEALMLAVEVDPSTTHAATARAMLDRLKK